MSIAIRAEDLGKKYQIGKKLDNSLRSSMTRMFAKSGKRDDFWALKDVNFEIKQGDVLGIIGRNGAGKSTLLKLLSQITAPSTGKIELYGRVASLLEVGTGFHPELTGRENIYLNGTILGMTRKEVAAKFDEIVAFSGIEKFIDTPVKHYSSGMYVRLGFAVAAHLEPEILVVDEVLAVGDAEFQKKCLGKMQDVAGQGRTVLFVSHNISSIKSLCKTGLYLKSGKLQMMDQIDKVVAQYQQAADQSTSYRNDSAQSIQLTHVSFSNSSAEFSNEETITISIRVNQELKCFDHYALLIRILDEYDGVITSAETKLNKTTGEYDLVLPSNFLKKGNYFLNIITYQPGVCQFDNVDCCNFSILDNNSKYAHLEGFDIGKVYLNEKWL